MEGSRHAGRETHSLPGGEGGDVRGDEETQPLTCECPPTAEGMAAPRSRSQPSGRLTLAPGESEAGHLRERH